MAQGFERIFQELGWAVGVKRNAQVEESIQKTFHEANSIGVLQNTWINEDENVQKDAENDRGKEWFSSSSVHSPNVTRTNSSRTSTVKKGIIASSASGLSKCLTSFVLY